MPDFRPNQWDIRPLQPILSRSAEAFRAPLIRPLNVKKPVASKSDISVNRKRSHSPDETIRTRLTRAAAASCKLAADGGAPTKINRAQLKTKLKRKFHVDDTILDTILGAVLENPPKVSFDDVIGQDQAVKLLRERVIYPALNPNLFVGQKILRPPRGVLLFGPTGNGKTMLAKACAAQTRYNFINLTSSVLVSKWVGDSEKLVRMVFEIAREVQPCIVFIDEIDAVLSQRSELEREDTRRFKNEFLTHFDGLISSADERIMLLGATNLPQSIDTAALRRFDLRVFLGPPDVNARELLLKNILRGVQHDLSDSDVKYLAEITQQYSASDLNVVVRNAAWVPLTRIDASRIPVLKQSEIPILRVHDVVRVIEGFVPSGYHSDLKIIQQWLNRHKQ